MVGSTTATRRHNAAQQGQCPKEDVINTLQIPSSVLLPCDPEGLYAYCANRIVSYSLEKSRAEGPDVFVLEEIGESHPLFGPASEILWDRVDGTRGVEWTCETPDLRIGIILEREMWCNPVREAKHPAVSRWFASDHGAKLWLTVERMHP